MRRLAVLALSLMVLYFGVTFVQVWRASTTDGARAAQAIVVLGAAQYDGRPSAVLRARLDHAAALYRDGVADVIMLTGGRQPGDRFTEASAAASYLIHAGVPESALRLESQGSSSWESLAAAARFLRQEGITDVVLVSSPYHSLRVEKIAGEVGLVGHASPARTEGGIGSVFRLGHEALAVGIGRVIGYGRLVDLDYRVSKVRGEAVRWRGPGAIG